MRKRKRDWPQIVYRYAATVTGAVPEQAWAQVRTQRDLWNDLCVLSALAAGEAKAEPANRKATWATWGEHATELVERSGLNWEAGPDVLDRFRTAMKGIGKDGKGPPRQHWRIDRVRLIHRYTGGGAMLPQIFAAKAKRLSLWIAGDGRVLDGHFGLDGEGDPIRFRAVYHRPLPEGAIVKRAAWCGELDVFGWHWSLHLTLEMPPAMLQTHAGPIAGMDLGWRVRGGDYLRIGVLIDEYGETMELRLPFDGSNGSTRKAGIPSDWRDVDRYAEQCAAGLERCKADLAASLEREQPGLVSTNRLRLMRDRGLRRLAPDLLDVAPESARIIETWDVADVKLRRRQAGLRTRLLRQRRYNYRLLAAWLCRRYSALAIEADMSLADLAMDSGGVPAIKAAQRYRQMAALSEFRMALTQAAAKTGTVIAGEAMDTTRLCAECSEMAEGGPALVLRCPRGHEWDQDANAARNLLAQIAEARGVDVEPETLRRSRRERGPQSLDVPQQLRAVAVQCALD